MGKEITKLCGHASNGLCSDHFTEVDNFGIGSKSASQMAGLVRSSLFFVKFSVKLVSVMSINTEFMDI